MHRAKLFNLIGCLFLSLLPTACQQELKNDKIIIWYGDQQEFGKLGHPQQWINILGNIIDSDTADTYSFSLNQGIVEALTIGPNDTRLARTGDFNIEIDRTRLMPGENIIQIFKNEKPVKQVNITYHPNNIWPLPYVVDWQNVQSIESAVQVVDGKWELTQEGIRTSEPWYDRVLAFGDSTWVDYSIHVEVKFHGFTPPEKGPPTYGVSHAAIALRWPGHDTDGNQPSVKWWPVGATCEFRLVEGLKGCSFRVLGDNKKSNRNPQKTHDIELEKWYLMKAQVKDLKDSTWYAAKIWPHGQTEPSDWDIEYKEGLEEDPNGSGLLLAHNTDVTFGKIVVTNLKNKNY